MEADEGKAAAAEEETHDASTRNTDADSRQPRVGVSRGEDAASSGVRSGGEMARASGGDDGSTSLDEEAAVGSIHHILKTAFKELYRVGAGDQEEDRPQYEGTETAASRQGARAIGSVGSGSGSRRGSSSATATETTSNTEGDTGHMGRGSTINPFHLNSWILFFLRIVGVL